MCPLKAFNMVLYGSRFGEMIDFQHEIDIIHVEALSYTTI